MVAIYYVLYMNNLMVLLSATVISLLILYELAKILKNFDEKIIFNKLRSKIYAFFNIAHYSYVSYNIGK